MNFDEIDDDAIYFIKPLCIYIRGRTLKSYKDRSQILAEIQTGEKNADFERRCYPNSYNIQVYRESYDPSVYTIYPSFGEINYLVQQLGFPNKSESMYCSIIGSVGKLFKSKTHYSKKLQNYTVEEFGLRIGPSLEYTSDPDHIPILKAPLPNPLQYKCQPRYRRLFGGSHLLQVWRTRIFPFNEDYIQSSIVHPLTLNIPNKVYFEEGWNPRYGNRWLIGGLEHKHKFKRLDIDEFYWNALIILGHRKRRPGPIGYDADQLEKDVKDAYAKLLGKENRRPSLGAVADDLLIDRKTLSKYLTRLGIKWPPEH
jgi:hypothetical protein